MVLSCVFPSHSPSECLDTADLVLFKIPLLMIFFLHLLLILAERCKQIPCLNCLWANPARFNESS